MTKKHVRIASVVMPVMIAMLLLFAGSSRVRASDQPSTANVAIKIDNFVFGPQAITFTKAGTYPYYCSVHPKMTGQVVVK
jgi:hypothetical protein